MTAEEMRAEIEFAYIAAVKLAAPGAKVGLSVPQGVTPISFSYLIPASAEDLDAHTFMARYGYDVAYELASAGTGVTHRCTHFAPIRVQDRPAVQVRGQGGQGGYRKRERAFIVHALAWGHHVPEYSHTKVWPHAIGADVPAASKGDKQ